MSETPTGLNDQPQGIRIVGTHHWLQPEELVGAVVVQTMGSDVIVRLTTGECLVVKSADLRAENAQVR